MSQAPSSVPRGLLVVPGYLETREPKNLEWQLTTDYLGAVRLAWAMQQQEPGERHVPPEDDGRDDPELAAILGIERRQRWSKLTGRAPAQEDDLITLSWMTGTPWRPKPRGDFLRTPAVCTSPGRTPGSRAQRQASRRVLERPALTSLLEARALLEAWRIDHNEERPHGAHCWRPPAELARDWTVTNQRQLASRVDQQPGPEARGLWPRSRMKLWDPVLLLGRLVVGVGAGGVVGHVDHPRDLGYQLA